MAWYRHKNKYVDQWKFIEDQHINLHNCEPEIHTEKRQHLQQTAEQWFSGQT